MSLTAPDRQRAPRSDGEQSRVRLLHAGLRLFAMQGFAKTSTREIAEAANTNLFRDLVFSDFVEHPSAANPASVNERRASGNHSRKRG